MSPRSALTCLTPKPACVFFSPAGLKIWQAARAFLLSARLLQNPYVAQVRIDLPDAEARLRFLQSGWAEDLAGGKRSEEHTPELQSRFGIPYAAFCLKKKKKKNGNMDNARPVTDRASLSRTHTA